MNAGLNDTWFTYDTMLPQTGLEAVLGNAGHRWLTALDTIDGNRSVMGIDIVSGGIFDTPTTTLCCVKRCWHSRTDQLAGREYSRRIQ